MTNPGALRAPAGLSARSRKLWNSTVAEYLLEPHHAAILEEACRALDRADQARKLLDEEGLAVRTSAGTVKTHPAAAVERDCRTLFARLLRDLDLEGEPGATPKTPRPLGRRSGDAEA